MEIKFKKTMAVMIALTIILASTGFSFASEQPVSIGPGNNVITPYWVGLNTISCTFDILSGGKANPIVRGTTHAGEVDYVNVKVALKRSSGSGWTTIKSWDKNITISLNKFTFNETYTVAKNYSYKYTTTVKSYKDGVLVDSVTLDSKIVMY